MASTYYTATACQQKNPPPHTHLPFFLLFSACKFNGNEIGESIKKPEWDMLFVPLRHLRGLPGWSNRPENAPRDFANDAIYLEHPEKKRLKQFQVERSKGVNCPTCFSFSWSASGCMNNGSCWGSMWKMTLIHHIEWLIALVNRTAVKMVYPAAWEG